MSDIDYIQTEQQLNGRNRWLEKHLGAVQPHLHRPLPCTVFAFSRREPMDRFTTRVGGLPGWPQRERWPTCEACDEPLTFVAQLDFRDLDLRLTVPGDVLTFHYCMNCKPWDSIEAPMDHRCIFTPQPEPPLADDIRTIGHARRAAVLTWHLADTMTTLVSAEAIPEQKYRFGPFYGCPHHTADYPVPPEAYGGGIGGEKWTYAYFTLRGTKIGGYPPPIQKTEVPIDVNHRPMQFLATIGSIKASVIDKTDSLEDPADLMWGDMGSLYVWYSGGGVSPEMAWFISCC